jgi:hypothetical protein
MTILDQILTTRTDIITQIDILEPSIQCLFYLNFSTLEHQNKVKII